jgi:mannose-1-phosphate guanylyltransferase
MGWSDLGSWSALADWLGPKAGSVHFSLDARGSFAHAPRKFTAAIGADNLIAVDTPDALLVTSRDRAQEVGKVVDYLRKKKLHRWL